MEYTFYETQTKQSDTFSVFSVICVRPFIRSCNVDHRHDVRRPISHARCYAEEMSYSRRSPSLRWISLWATTIVAVESPTDLFVASYWLERSSSRFSVTLLVFSRADHSTLQVLTTFYVVLSPLFIEGLLQKPSSSSDLLWLVHDRDVRCRG